jgi:bifunctional non-homologous end joining protein LigD
MTLAKYKQKRDFTKTPEPKGKVRLKKSKKLLYVIQKHAASHLHYDFRLELNGVLLSWAVPKGPCLDPKVKRLAIHVEDHPVEYGTFEGIIPQDQYGGGTVMLWDQGTWISEDDDAVKAYHKGSMKLTLKGEKLHGLWKLIRINKDDKTWLLIKTDDDYAKTLKKYDVTVEEPNSVLTQQNIDEIAENYNKVWGKKGLEKAKKKKASRKPNIKTIKQVPKLKFNLKPSIIPTVFFPELATLVDKPPVGKKWMHEIKFDGYRIIAIKKNGKTRLMSRNNIDWTCKFQNIAKEINEIPIKNLILDGEVVVLDADKKSDFQALQNAMKDGSTNKFYYYIFDLPYYDKYNLTGLNLLERKNYLQQILIFKTEALLYSDHFFGSGKKIFQKSCELALEGIISKDSTSQYVSKRTTSWLKIKCLKRQEFVIGGFTNPRGTRSHFGSLLIGTYNKRGDLIYNGHVGTGFTESSLQSLYKLLKARKSSTNPFSTKPPRLKEINWVKPNLIAEIEFTEWTKDNSLRHPSFKGLRNDKKSANIIKETPIPVENVLTKNKAKTKMQKKSDFKLTNPNKILYSEDKISKQDLAEYYDTVQKWILPYIINRPLTLVRCPEGYKKCFYQKHLNEAAPEDLFGIPIKEKNGKAEYNYIKDISGLLSLIQLGVLEIHPWGSRIEDVEYPDMLIFDLDPSPEMTWNKIVNAAKLIKKNLEKIKLKSFVKTTGGKGLHVVVPIKPEYDWEEVKNFSKIFVNLLVQMKPDEYISKISKQQRKGKIFIDYLRNQRGATAIAPFSTRARPHAPVSTPLDWNELTNRFEDTYYTIKTLPDRLKKLKKDPWNQFYKTRQSLNLDKYK